MTKHDDQQDEKINEIATKIKEIQESKNIANLNIYVLVINVNLILKYFTLYT